MGKSSKSKKPKQIKSREQLLHIKKMSDLQIAMIEDSTTKGEHVELFGIISSNYPTLDVCDPIYIKNNMERMTLWNECARKTLQSTILLNSESMTEIVNQRLENNDYIDYVQSVLDHNISLITK